MNELEPLTVFLVSTFIAVSATAFHQQNLEAYRISGFQITEILTYGEIHDLTSDFWISLDLLFDFLNIYIRISTDFLGISGCIVTFLFLDFTWISKDL